MLEGAAWHSNWRRMAPPSSEFRYVFSPPFQTIVISSGRVFGSRSAVGIRVCHTIASLDEPEAQGLPVIGNAFNRTRDALDSVAFEARQRITLVSLLCAALVFAVFTFAYLIRRKR